MNQEREQVRDIVRRRGWNGTSYQILNPGFTYWIDRELDAAAGYIARHHVRVVGGAPVSSDDRFVDVLRAFEADAASADHGVIYFCAEQRIAELAQSDPRRLTFPIGAQPVWQPGSLVAEFMRHASLRAQLNRARNKGLRVRQVRQPDTATLNALERCLAQWVGRRGLPPLHFLIETDTLRHLEDRRLFIAERDGVPIAFLVATPIPAREGWLIEQIVRGAASPNGTAELLVYHTALALDEAGAHLLTLGLAPLAHRGAPLVDHAPVWLRGLLYSLRAFGHRFYNFEGLETFKAKFAGSHWDPVYASLAPGTSLAQAMLAVTTAFSGEPIRRFVPHTIGRALLRALDK